MSFDFYHTVSHLYGFYNIVNILENCLIFVGREGLEPPNSEERWVTVISNCHYATFPILCGPYRTRTANPPCKGGVLANYTIQPNILNIYLSYVPCWFRTAVSSFFVIMIWWKNLYPIDKLWSNSGINKNHFRVPL